jgi:hypothetical protein
MFPSVVIKSLYLELYIVLVTFKINEVSEATPSSIICYKYGKYDIDLGPLEVVSITAHVPTEYDFSHFYT